MKSAGLQCALSRYQTAPTTSSVKQGLRARSSSPVSMV